MIIQPSNIEFLYPCTNKLSCKLFHPHYTLITTHASLYNLFQATNSYINKSNNNKIVSFFWQEHQYATSLSPIIFLHQRTCSLFKLLLSDSRMHEQYFIFTTASPLGSTTSIRCCCHPDQIEAATAPMLKSRVSTLFKHTLGSYTAIKDKEIWEGTSNPSLHYLW